MTLDRSLSACVVDDEELARRGIRSRLSHHDDVNVVAECTSGPKAVNAIRSRDLDLIFLNVQMPGLDGFDVIDEVGVKAMPVVIFVTAYDEHAGEFENKLAGLLSGLDDNEQSESADAPNERFVVKSGGRVQFVKAEDIQWVEAAGDYVQLHTADKKHLLRKTMKEMEAALDGDQFLRIHRSTIVNVDYLREMRPYGSNTEYTVVLKDGTERKLSRAYRDEVDDFFDGAL